MLRSLVTPDGKIDAGKLAESLVFYGHVHLVMDQGSLSQIASSISIEILCELVDEGRLELDCIRDALVVRTDTTAGLAKHSFAKVNQFKTADNKVATDEVILNRALIRAFGTLPRQRLRRSLMDRIRFRSISTKDTASANVGVATMADLRDAYYVERAARAAVLGWVPNFNMAPNSHFRLLEVGNQYLVDTNYDYDAITAAYRVDAPASDTKIDSALILASIQDAVGDLALAADYSCEIYTSPWCSNLMQTKLNTIANRSKESRDQIALFESLALDRSPAIAETINSGERLFAEIIPVLHRADQFKKWINEIQEDKGLVKEYFDSIRADSWLDSMPVKILRFALTYKLGALLIGWKALGFAAADAFLIDPLLKGWRPDQFIDQTVAPFVRRD